jgi:hypothetical protein
MGYKTKMIGLLTWYNKVSQEIEPGEGCWTIDRFMLMPTVWGDRIYEDGGWICEKKGEGAACFWTGRRRRK